MNRSGRERSVPNAERFAARSCGVMRTASYTANFLGPLGAAFDRRATAALGVARLAASGVALYRDTDPRQAEFDRLVGDIRERRYDRLLLRWVADLCLTPLEVFDLIRTLTGAGVTVEVSCWVTPARLFAKCPERLARFRRRSAVAKVLRLHRAGLGVEAVARAALVGEKAVARTLAKHGLSTPTESMT